ncbi:MAG: ribonuclease HI [Oscillospiraceae bacterium]|jgi:ribonuclease HI|nr:ribonuclease HI [Oscillospiraceae bacterium]
MKEKTPPLEIYTDGGCLGNPGPGAWAYVILTGTHEISASGGEAATTNNRMELTAVLEGLKALREPCAVTVYSDSKYVVDGMTKGWAKGWKARGWKKADKSPALNPDLWGALLDLCQEHEVRFTWVRGHGDNVYNNRCDELATGAIKNN